MTLEEQIAARVGEVRTDSFDLSFGEIANLHVNKELVIQPEYQRLFRWSLQQKSHLIESILLELPVPQIFVIENQDGAYRWTSKSQHNPPIYGTSKYRHGTVDA